ncbi:MAG TPA: LuxR C-terminal-related transcriptional regulator [Rubrobacter sp.]|nr:LuxR C-terminal-related transcriptional regulator [Rubrobacter sp.]
MSLAVSTVQKAHDNTAVVELPEALESVTRALTVDAVFVVDPENRIVHWDARAESLTGLLAEEMVGEFCYEVLTGESEDGTSFCAHVCSAVRLAWAGQPAPGYEVRIFTRSGRERWVGVSSLAVETEEGPFVVNLMRNTQAAHETLAMARQLIRISGQDAPQEGRARNHRDTPMLTQRQLEVLGLLASGKSAREICRELYLSQATVRNHIRALLLALGAHSQLEALARAREAGLLDA